jgi:uncharacterized phiE125 gp8 family phage protein
VDERYSLKLVTAPASEPVTRAEAKTHCRIPTAFTGDDTYVDGLITASREYIEGRTGRQFVTATWRLFLDDFPAGEIIVPRFPLASVTHLKYYDTDGVQQTLSSGAYIVDDAVEPGEIVLAPNNDWPVVQTDRRNAIEIEFIAGQAAASVPAKAKHAVKFLVAHFYELREPVDALNYASIPFTLDALIMALKPGTLP